MVLITNRVSVIRERFSQNGSHEPNFITVAAVQKAIEARNFMLLSTQLTKMINYIQDGNNEKFVKKKKNDELVCTQNK